MKSCLMSLFLLVIGCSASLLPCHPPHCVRYQHGSKDWMMLKRHVINSTLSRRELTAHSRKNQHKKHNWREEDPAACSQYCQSRAGDAVCDMECRTPGCLGDLGDCPLAYHNCTDHHHCPHDGVCRSECALHGCGSTAACVMGEDTHMRQFFLLHLPLMGPSTFLQNIARMERQVWDEAWNQRLDSLGSGESAPIFQLAGDEAGPLIWGFHKSTGRAERLEFSADPKEQQEQRVRNRAHMRRETLALFQLGYSRLIDINDEAIDVIRKLGTATYHAAVLPLVLSQEQYSNYSPDKVVAARKAADSMRDNAQRQWTYRKGFPMA